VNKAQATAKDIEGAKVPRSMCKLLIVEQNQLAGKAKQAQPQGDMAVEDAIKAKCLAVAT